MKRIIAKSLLASIVLLSGLTTAGAQEKKVGVTTISVTQHREEPDFTAELGNQMLCGTPVEIIDSKGYWRKVNSPEPYSAWCVDLAVKEMGAAEFEEYMRRPKMICTALHSSILEKPSPKSGKITDVVQGNILIFNGRTKKGYAHVSLADGRSGYIPCKDVRDFLEWATEADASAENIIATAGNYLGIPYLWGGTSVNGLDCSGLTRMVWFMNGVLLPRNASQQAAIGLKVDIAVDTRNFPTESPLGNHAGSRANHYNSDDFKKEMLRRTENLKPGDLIFFGKPGENGAKDKISHVGIYLGEGRFIHASRYVRINSLIPGTEDWYDGSAKMIAARRLVGEEGTKGITRICDSPMYF